MSGARSSKSHWKELVASQAARTPPPSEPKDEKPEAPDGEEPRKPLTLPLPRLTWHDWKERYFQPYRYYWLAGILVLWAIGLLVAYGPDHGRPGRRAIYGDVTVGDKPPLRGSISFYPGEGHAGPAANTGIFNGRYKFTRDDGPFSGPHRVVISFVRDAAEEAQFQQPPTKGRTIAAKPEPPKEKETVPGQAEAQGVAKPEGKEAEPEPPPAAPAAKSYGKEFDVEVPGSGSQRLDFQIPD